jgi:hypothetical protein
MNLVGVPSISLDRVWSLVRDRIDYTVKNFGDDDGTTAEDIYAMLLNRDAQLWVSDSLDAAWVTQILTKNDDKTMLVWLFNADKLTDEHWELFEHIHDWAKELGCVRSKVVVRPGFEKSLAQHGWKKKHVTMVREI